MKLQSKWLVAAFAILAFVAVSTVNAAPATWTGKLSDAMCGASHGSNGGTQDTGKTRSAALAKPCPRRVPQVCAPGSWPRRRRDCHPKRCCH